MKKLFLILALFLMACQTIQPVAESPKEIPVPEAPASTPPTPISTPPATTPTAPADCKTACLDSCNANLDKVCGRGTDYYGCLQNCNSYLRVEGCKAVCSTESYPECSAVFKGECKQECNKKCPLTT